MDSFQHIAPGLRLYSGPESLQSLGKELDRLGRQRAVIFCGPSLAQAGAPLEAVRLALGPRCAGAFTAVRAHSPVPVVAAGAAALREMGADAVVAVGGGSAIVTARAASILLAEGGTARALSTSRDANGRMHSPRLLAEKLPQLVVPTTPTTAMVKAGSAVFDPDSGDRLAMFDPKTRAHAIFIHPLLTASAPARLIASASLDGLTAMVEGLTSPTSTPLADALLIHALRLLARHPPHLAANQDAPARAALMHAAILSGLGTDHTGAGIATVLGHAIGAGHAVDNGIVKAIVLPHALRFNGTAAGLEKLADALRAAAPHMPGNPPVEHLIGTLQQLIDPLGLPRRLRDLGLPEAALPAIAARGMNDWFLRGNPRPVRQASDLEHVLRAAW